MNKYTITAKGSRILVNGDAMAVDVNHADLAQLLAAAPEMLEVLKAIVARTKPAHLDEGITIEPTVQQIKIAQAVIAKAEPRDQ